MCSTCIKYNLYFIICQVESVKYIIYFFLGGTEFMENRIKELRQRNNMSQIRLSIELEVSQETISAYENGKYYPSFQTLLKLSQILHSSIDYMMGLSDRNTLSDDITDDEVDLLRLYRELNQTEKLLAVAYVHGLHDSNINRK